MRHTLSLVAVLLMLVIGLSQVSLAQDEPSVPDKLQAQFASSLKGSVQGVEAAEWKSHIDLWVQSSGADKNKARTIASDVIIKGKKELGQTFCVHVHNGDWQDLGRMCSY